MSGLVSSGDGLSSRHRVFVDAYIGEANWNAAAAARMAGYAESSARQGSKLLRRPDVKAAISRRLDELAMPAQEVLARLTEQARGSYADFIDEEGKLDLKGLKGAGLMRLVKKISEDRTGKLTVEFHDAQRALEMLGKHQRLFVERVEAEVTLTGFEGWSDQELETYASTGRRPARSANRE